MKKRERPIISVACGDCGGRFMGSVLLSGFDVDQELFDELAQYAKEGHTITVVDADEFHFDSCKCNKNKQTK